MNCMFCYLTMVSLPSLCRFHLSSDFIFSSLGSSHLSQPPQTAFAAAPTSYSVTNLPAGLSFSSSTGEITGTPTSEGAAAVVVRVTGTYSAGPSVYLDITMTIEGERLHFCSHLIEIKFVVSLIIHHRS